MANESPWARTKIRDGQYLDILKIRPVPEDSDDVIYEIQSQYHQRPDLLAYDMYGSSKLWWVYAQRNMDTRLVSVYSNPSSSTPLTVIHLYLSLVTVTGLIPILTS